ncbi:MAG: protein kinase [Planctomycetes bacterium]|nr:protein kinase [Planctomycetota bacterium]
MMFRCTICDNKFEVPADAGSVKCASCGFEHNLSGATVSLEVGSEAVQTEVYKSPPRWHHKYLPEGYELGGYRIEHCIAKGGMGVVYLATQMSLGRKVAIKVLATEFAHEPDFQARFERESRTLAELSHPGIVSIIDRGRDGEIFFFVMEYVEGVSLRDVMEEKQLGPMEAFRIIRQICEALEFAHMKGVVHRDMKPENILVDKAGRVKITDFGLSRIITQAETERITKTNTIMGTFDYMAPEQREKSKAVDHRADIYSLGVIFYEMLTGELPVGKFDPPSRKSDGVTIELDKVVLKILEKDPDRRYQRASNVATEVDRVERTSSTGRKRGASHDAWGTEETSFASDVKSFYPWAKKRVNEDKKLRSKFVYTLAFALAGLIFALPAFFIVAGIILLTAIVRLFNGECEAVDEHVDRAGKKIRKAAIKIEARAEKAAKHVAAKAKKLGEKFGEKYEEKGAELGAKFKDDAKAFAKDAGAFAKKTAAHAKAFLDEHMKKAGAAQEEDVPNVSDIEIADEAREIFAPESERMDAYVDDRGQLFVDVKRIRRKLSGEDDSDIVAKTLPKKPSGFFGFIGRVIALILMVFFSLGAIGVVLANFHAVDQVEIAATIAINEAMPDMLRDPEGLEGLRWLRQADDRQIIGFLGGALLMIYLAASVVFGIVGAMLRAGGKSGYGPMRIAWVAMFISFGGAAALIYAMTPVAQKWAGYAYDLRSENDEVRKHAVDEIQSKYFFQTGDDALAEAQIELSATTLANSEAYTFDDYSFDLDVSRRTALESNNTYAKTKARRLLSHVTTFALAKTEGYGYDAPTTSLIAGVVIGDGPGEGFLEDPDQSLRKEASNVLDRITDKRFSGYNYRSRSKSNVYNLLDFGYDPAKDPESAETFEAATNWREWRHMLEYPFDALKFTETENPEIRARRLWMYADLVYRQTSYSWRESKMRDRDGSALMFLEALLNPESNHLQAAGYASIQLLWGAGDRIDVNDFPLFKQNRGMDEICNVMEDVIEDITDEVGEWGDLEVVDSLRIFLFVVKNEDSIAKYMGGVSDEIEDLLKEVNKKHGSTLKEALEASEQFRNSNSNNQQNED